MLLVAARVVAQPANADPSGRSAGSFNLRSQPLGRRRLKDLKPEPFRSLFPFPV